MILSSSAEQHFYQYLISLICPYHNFDSKFIVYFIIAIHLSLGYYFHKIFPILSLSVYLYLWLTKGWTDSKRHRQDITQVTRLKSLIERKHHQKKSSGPAQCWILQTFYRAILPSLSQLFPKQKIWEHFLTNSMRSAPSWCQSHTRNKKRKKRKLQTEILYRYRFFLETKLFKFYFWSLILIQTKQAKKWES